MTDASYPSSQVDAWGTGTEYAAMEAGGLEAAQLLVSALETIRQELAGIRSAAEEQAGAEAMRQLSEQLIEEAREQDETPSPPLDPLPAPDFHP